MTAIEVVCTRCRRGKHRSEFGANSRKTNGLKSWCKKCSAASKSQGCRENIEENRAKARAYETSRRTPEDSRRRLLWQKYGLTPEGVDAMAGAQGNACAICGATQPSGRWANWFIDHNHDTGQVRALLCLYCNTGLGSFKDSPALLKAAILYLASQPHAPGHTPGVHAIALAPEAPLCTNPPPSSP